MQQLTNFHQTKSTLMKKMIRLLLIPSALLILTPFSCKKSIANRTANLPALDASNEDLSAGTWKPILLPRPDTFAVAVPAATNSTSYIAELNEIKGYQHNLTSEDQQNIKYWIAGGVLRWNEIMRGLVAKYNLPPYQNPDGSYPIPNSNNPFAYPLFPFSNPPYAARAYAYVSAAQYDALIACWHYKSLYNRPTPNKVDSSVKSWVPATGLSSYPSEAAVLAGVTAEMMKLLFPDEIANIQVLATQQEQANIMAGVAARSDIVAGEALGRQVADLFIARGRADNAGKAVGTPTNWTNFVTQTIAKGNTPWYSLESPQRPPMLPLFGSVKSFLLDSATVASLIPDPPPTVGSAQMTTETQEVYSYIKNPSRDNIRIVQFWADGAGTYTPPGHWNAIASEDFIKQNFSEVRWARNMALLNITLMDAAIVCWSTKYLYFNARPTQLNPSIKTLTGIPNFPSYISGHSTFTGAAATVLGHIIPSRADAYMQMAQEASLSRLLGGLHFRSDITIGLTVGQNVGAFAVQRAQIDGAE
jgi:hypothetical protein